MSSRKSSTLWLQRQKRDGYAQQAHNQQLRSRAWFKLQQIHQRRPQCFQPGITVDLGAAPGGWSHYLAHHLPKERRIIACDLLPMAPIAGVEWLQGDFLDETTQKELHRITEGEPLQMVLSDLSPNLSGISAVDQARSLELNLQAWHWAHRYLREGGHCILKAFAGASLTELEQAMRPHFLKLERIKPPASRAQSREIYLLGEHHRALCRGSAAGLE